MKSNNAREELIVVDILRLILICGVITIHTGAPWYFMAIGRIGVPFSFALAGFFTNKDNVNFSIKRNVNRFLKWLAIYSPFMIYDAIKEEMDVILFFKKILFITPYYLWFLVALIVCLLLYKKTFKISSKIKIILAIILYVFGCIGNTYLDIFKARNLYTPYFEVFLTVRNGIFFAPIFFIIGQNIKNMKDKNTNKVFITVISILIFALYFLEYRVVNLNPLVYEDASMYFTLPVVVFAVLSGAILLNYSIDIKDYLNCFGKPIRQLSTWIYLSQAALIKLITLKVHGGGMKLAVMVLAISIVLFIFMYKNKYGRKIMMFLC